MAWPVHVVDVVLPALPTACSAYCLRCASGMVSRDAASLLPAWARERSRPPRGAGSVGRESGSPRRRDFPESRAPPPPRCARASSRAPRSARAEGFAAGMRAWRPHARTQPRGGARRARRCGCGGVLGFSWSMRLDLGFSMNATRAREEGHAVLQAVAAAASVGAQDGRPRRQRQE